MVEVLPVGVMGWSRALRWGAVALPSTLLGARLAVAVLRVGLVGFFK